MKHLLFKLQSFLVLLVFTAVSAYYNRQIKKIPTEKQNVSLKHILT